VGQSVLTFDELDGHYDGVNDQGLSDIPPFDTQISITRGSNQWGAPGFDRFKAQWLDDLRSKYHQSPGDLSLVSNVRQIDGMPADGVDAVLGIGGKELWVYLFFSDNGTEAWTISYLGNQMNFFPRAHRDFDQIVDTFRFTN
jgi:hypothetical protein